MVSVTVCTVICADEQHYLEVDSPDQDHAQLMPRHLVLWLCLEVGVGHAGAVVVAELQQALFTLVDLANSEVSKPGRP